MAVSCDRMWVQSRWIYGADSRRDPKVENPEYHPPILFHHDVKTGNAYFSDEAGRPLDPAKVPQYILDDIADNPVHVVPQYAPPNIRPYTMDPETGQEFKPGQHIQKDILQNVPLLNENRSNDLAAIENRRLLERNNMLAAQNNDLLARLEKIEKAQAAKPKPKRGRPKGSKNKTK